MTTTPAATTDRFPHPHAASQRSTPNVPSATHTLQAFSHALSDIRGVEQDECTARIAYFVLEALLTFDLALIAVSICFAMRSFHNHTYRYLPSARALKDYHAGLIAHFEGGPRRRGRNPEELARQEYDGYLTMLYVEAATANFETNTTRKMFIHIASRCIVWTIVLLGLTLIPFLLVASSDTISVRVVGFDDTILPQSPVALIQRGDDLRPEASK